MVVLGALPKLPDWTVQQATQWVAAALAEEAALRQHDGQMFPQNPKIAEELEVARELHQAWSRWADSADELYERVRPLLNAGHHIDGASKLDHAIGRIRARLQVTVDS